MRWQSHSSHCYGIKGNCSPRFVRITTCAPGNSATLQAKSGLPLALVISPFALPENGEDAVPIAYMGANESPPRCTRCHG
jgi:protein transport protein SEC24